MEARRGENKERYQGMRVRKDNGQTQIKRRRNGAGGREADVTDMKSKGYLSTC